LEKQHNSSLLVGFQHIAEPSHSTVLVTLFIVASCVLHQPGNTSRRRRSSCSQAGCNMSDQVLPNANGYVEHRTRVVQKLVSGNTLVGSEVISSLGAAEILRPECTSGESHSTSTVSPGQRWLSHRLGSTDMMAHNVSILRGGCC